MNPRNVVALALCAIAVAWQANADEIGDVHFNQTWIEDQARDVDVTDPRAILAQVFSALPDRPFVWPTENYYYFRFTANGVDYGGNFRLHPVERDEGLINFAYFDTGDPSQFHHLLLGPDDGVDVERLSATEYAVTFDGRTVTFVLNPISQTDPGPPLVGPKEAFIGRGFDELGLAFLLVFNETIDRFIWILDAEQPAPVPLAPMAPDLDVHVSSGFVFYRPPGEERHILAGVDAHEVVRNTYFDGPFDQLPDNWLPETRFQELALRADPNLRGAINARGEFEGRTARMAVMPYLQYNELGEVWQQVRACDDLPAGPGRLACVLPPAP